MRESYTGRGIITENVLEPEQDTQREESRERRFQKGMRSIGGWEEQFSGTMKTTRKIPDVPE